jgi:hypothetical protein
MSPIKGGSVGSVIFLAMSLFFLVLFSTNRPQAQSDSPKVEGYVYDYGGKPMNKVEVRVVYFDQAFVKTETDKTGHYSLAFTKSDKPIRVSYLTQQQIYFPELKELSGSTNHNISRTQQEQAGVYTVPVVIQLNYEAQVAISLPATDDKLKQHYRKLLSNVRIKQGAVTDEVTSALVQSLFNETRRQYGMGTEELKSENGTPLPARIELPTIRQPAEANSCMTIETLQKMLASICNNNRPPIVGLSRADAIDLRNKLGCSGPRLPPNSRDAPNPRPTPNRNRP